MENTSQILIVEDDLSLREALVDTLELAGYEVCSVDNGRAALDYLDDHNISMIISDVQMPKMNGHQLLKQVKRNFQDIPMLLMTAYGTIDKAIEAMKDGAVDYLVKPFEPEVLVSTISKFISLQDVDIDMIAIDPVTVEMAQLAKRVADSEATVMITGDSGTGKEVLARFIHQHSPRADKPFVAINCAAIPENMLEATLFGYEKGAFTGAYKSSAGKFEQAQGGTLLLDEISEMDLGLQAKILRVLQEKEVERLGGQEIIDLDVRILATSNRNMYEYVKDGKFREDLFYRLNVFPIKIPTLSERKADIIPLSEYMLEQIARKSAKPIPDIADETKDKLLSHFWPGNIRELDNVLQRAFILHMDDEIKPQDILLEMNKPEQSISAAVQNQSTVNEAENSVNLNDSLNSDLKNREYEIILDILKEFQGNRQQTAERLGISQRTLRYKLAKMRDSGIAIPTTFKTIAHV